MKSQLLYNASASLVCLMLGALPTSAQQIAKNDLATRPQVMESYGKLTMSFEANQGQTDRSVSFCRAVPATLCFLPKIPPYSRCTGRSRNRRYA
jgi:hypothetical protein